MGGDGGSSEKRLGDSPPVARDDVARIEYTENKSVVTVTGTAWVVNSEGGIYRRTGGSWQRMPGLAKEIGVGAKGSVWVIGTDATGGGYGIYNWNRSDWTRLTVELWKFRFGNTGQNPFPFKNKSEITPPYFKAKDCQSRHLLKQPRSWYGPEKRVERRRRKKSREQRSDNLPEMERHILTADIGTPFL